MKPQRNSLRLSGKNGEENGRKRFMAPACILGMNLASNQLRYHLLFVKIQLLQMKMLVRRTI